MHSPASTSGKPTLLLLALVASVAACPRPVFPELAVANSPVPDAAPPPLLVDRVFVTPFRDALNLDGGIPDGASSGTQRVFPEDVLHVVGSGWDPLVVELKVGTQALTLLPASSALELQAAIPRNMAAGLVQVGLGTRHLTTGITVALAGPGHVERPRVSTLREPQLTMTSAGAGPACDDYYYNTVCDKTLFYTFAVTFNLGLFTAAAEPERSFAASLLFPTTISDPPYTQVIQPDPALLPAGSRVAFGPVAPAVVPVPGSHALLELATVEQVALPGTEGATAMVMYRARVGTRLGPMEPDLRGPLLRRDGPWDDGALHQDTGYFTALRYRRTNGVVSGFEVVAFQEEGDGLVEIPVPDADLVFPDEVPVALGHVQPWALSDVLFYSPDPQPTLLLLSCRINAEFGTNEAHLLMVTLPQDVQELSYYGPSRVEFDRNTSSYAAGTVCTDTLYALSEGAEPPPQQLMTPLARDVHVIHRPGFGTAASNAPASILSVFSDVCDYVKQDAGLRCTLRDLDGNEIPDGGRDEDGSFIWDGGPVFQDCVPADDNAYTCQPRLDEDGGTLYRLDETARGSYVAAVPFHDWQQVLALEELYEGQPPTLVNLDLQYDGRLVSQRTSRPTTSEYAALIPDPSGDLAYAVKRSGDKVDVLDHAGTLIQTLSVLGTAGDLWPLTDVERSITVYPNILISAEPNGALRAYQVDPIGIFTPVPEETAAQDVGAYWATAIVPDENRWTGFRAVLERRVLDAPVPDGGHPHVEFENPRDGGPDATSGFACDLVDWALAATPQQLIAQGTYQELCIMDHPLAPPPHLFNPVPGLLVDRHGDGLRDGPLRAFNAARGKLYLMARDNSGDAGDPNVLPQVFTVVDTLASPATHASFDKTPGAIATTPEGGLLGVFFGRNGEGAASYACITPDNRYIDRGEPAFNPRAMVVSPDGRRLYAAVEHAILEMELSGDSSVCPYPVVRNIIDVPANPDTLRSDATGARILWLDSQTQTQGRLQE